MSRRFLNGMWAMMLWINGWTLIHEWSKHPTWMGIVGIASASLGAVYFVDEFRAAARERRESELQALKGAK